MTPTAYRGRFAPTPSGPLHLGSLLTALASFLEARARGGRWLLRIDDLDRARCPAGLDGEILRQLEAHGLSWDEPPRYQSRHVDEYRGALERLRADGLLYACDCTRAALRAGAAEGPDGPVYAGTCRARSVRSPRSSLRLRVPDERLCFDDAGQGRQCRDLAREVGDFVVRRNDGVIAYQLACAVDESAQRITEVVRGADLLGSTFQQQVVMRALGHAPPRYRHLPVLADGRGRKLSKQNRAPAIDPAGGAGNLLQCLALLGQAPPGDLAGARAREVLEWALGHWSAAKVRKVACLRAM